MLLLSKIISLLIFNLFKINSSKVKDSSLDFNFSKKVEVSNFTGEELIFESIKQNQGPNWLADVATFRISHNESDISFLYPERRFYPASQINTSEPAILSRLFYDLYIVLGEKDIKNKNFAVRVYYSPLLNFIWIGIAFMAFGGILSLSDKKHRVSYKTLRKNRNLSIK